MNQILMPWYNEFQQDILPDWEVPPLLDTALGDYVTQEVVTTLALVKAHRRLHRLHAFGVNQGIINATVNSFMLAKNSCVYVLANANPRGIRSKFLMSLIGGNSSLLWDHIYPNEFVKKYRHPEAGLMYTKTNGGGPTNKSICDSMLKQYKYLNEILLENGLEVL